MEQKKFRSLIRKSPKIELLSSLNYFKTFLELQFQFLPYNLQPETASTKMKKERNSNKPQTQQRTIVTKYL